MTSSLDDPLDDPLAVADGADETLESALERVRTLMDAQTATVLLLDVPSGKLRPAAAIGFGRRWRTASHVALGEGFAGRIAATRTAQVVDLAAGATVVNPLLLTSGVASLLGVPLLSRGRLLGVVHVGYHQRRSFSSEDVADLELAAASVVRTIETHDAHDAHLSALVLQRSFLPTLRDVDGLEMAARYLPADGDFGGDWYDVFPLPGGRLGVVMGDVMGHGLQASIVMGRLRSVLRAHALEEDDPAVVLRLLDRTLCHFEEGTTATVLYAVTAPPFAELRVSNAGHPPPVRARVGGVEGAAIEPDPLLGFDPDARRTTTVLDLAPGEALALFTDGLVDLPAHDDGQDPYWERLSRIAQSFSAEDHPETACTRILAETVGDDGTEDDVALLVLRRPPD
ncbi:PP2C family protein-serine/threonine phosphatase [Nocardioides zeae]|uniref:Sigma-B regulation protein RsbU (Phosphoserine phosphatase) n=1 Tax=Nocardioides zeae TaxID=1457234 RepID=A0AAJ1U5W4_9ACTN|nr:GAF domain-containing SpoIIE family protein phosphatase [Nocardioides zeae]MDQ1106590.1 sigma-B regulation protein RsbU (phosphoserine phosphatase) [Nocardioides zeae]